MLAGDSIRVLVHGTMSDGTAAQGLIFTMVAFSNPQGHITIAGDTLYVSSTQAGTWTITVTLGAVSAKTQIAVRRVRVMFPLVCMTPNIVPNIGPREVQEQDSTNTVIAHGPVAWSTSDTTVAAVNADGTGLRSHNVGQTALIAHMDSVTVQGLIKVVNAVPGDC